MYKKASRLGLKIKTPVGNLNITQLWSCSLTVLDDVAITLQSQISTKLKKSFINATDTSKDLDKLKFDIVYDILQTRLNDEAAIIAKKNNEKYNQKIMSVIAEHEEKELKGRSIEDLKAMLK